MEKKVKKNLDATTQKQNKNMEFEEMEKAEEFGSNGFLIGFGVGAVVTAIAVLT